MRLKTDAILTQAQTRRVEARKTGRKGRRRDDEIDITTI